MQVGTSENQDRAVPTQVGETPVVVVPPEAPRPALRPEIRAIVERNWPRDEEALRLLGR